VPVRLHSACLTGDLFGSLKCDCGDQLRETVQWMAENDGGILLYLDQEGRGNGISNKMRAYKLQSQGWDTYDADEVLGFDLDQRHFDFAATMLKQLGVTRVTALDQQPAEGRRDRGGRARGRRDAARARPAQYPQCPLSRLQARPRRPCHRHGRADGARRAKGLTRPQGLRPGCSWRIDRHDVRAARCRPVPRTRHASARWPLASVFCIVFAGLARLVLALALGRRHDPLGRQGAFPSAAPVPRERAWHKGLSPFWTPYVFSGSPQVADPQSLIFSPPFALIAALNPTPDFRWSDGAVLGTLLAGAFAIVLLFRDRDWHPAGAVVAALAFAFGASAAWRIQHVGQVLSLGYFAITLATDRACAGTRLAAYGFAAGVVAGFMVLGRDQVALLGVYVLTGLVIAAIAMAQQPWRALRASLPPLMAGVVGAILVATVPILLTAFFAEESNRPEIDLVGAGKGSLHPAALLTGLFANLYGAAGPLENFWGAPSPAWEARFGPLDLYLARNMSQLYLGLLPMG
jgi:hypothetical protein